MPSLVPARSSAPRQAEKDTCRSPGALAASAREGSPASPAATATPVPMTARRLGRKPPGWALGPTAGTGVLESAIGFNQSGSRCRAHETSMPSVDPGCRSGLAKHLVVAAPACE